VSQIDPRTGAGPGLDPLVDPGALKSYLDDFFGNERELDIQRHQAGHSNETFFVTRGDDAMVLRRPPRPPYLPTAHDVKREHTLLDALHPVGVRVPRPIVYCADESVIGAHFYLMEKVDGTVIRHEVPSELDTPEQHRRIGEELIDALAELHMVDWRAAGLDGFGKPSGYISRQLKRWNMQLEGATKLTRPVPDLVALTEWLHEHEPPEQEHTVVQGDYKLDNVVFAPGDQARLVAILDWEMGTIGDPLADLGYAMSFWREPGDAPDPLHSALGDVFSGEGWHTRAALIERYAAKTGRDMTDLTFYLVLAVWKLAILLEGSYARHLMGTTDDPFFAALEQGVPALAARALQIARDGA
jgi:aminoglycoside phosphotransferase (APT) family kinase protein